MKKTICLNMIVKNENSVIKRCLASVKPIIDYWIIIDTGSTDGTQQTIREFMRGIPGELHEYPWVDFAHNRNQALALSKGKGDYLLFIDADERLVFDESFDFPSLDKDCYFFSVHQPSGINYFREALIENHPDWKWVGPVHEAIISSKQKTYDVAAGIVNYSVTTDGNRSRDPEKYLKDAAILEKALKDEPDNSRYVFYLALSYGNAKDYTSSLKWHKKRLSMGGSEQEIFYSLLSIGKIQEHLEADQKTLVESYTKAYLYRPSRAEPLYFLANYYMREENYILSYLLAKMGLTIPLPPDIIFVQGDIYETGLLFQLADSSYKLGKYTETLNAYEKLLKTTKISPFQRQAIEKNIAVVQSLIRHADSTSNLR